MRNIWVRFGCFLTGYNYGILSGCSEAAFKAVKKYTAAMLIVCILWFFIGFTFAQRYLLAGLTGCLLAGGISVTIIVQIEKQIILSINPGKGLLIFRSCLALIMAFLGSVIIDQILLQKDIETEKISYISRKVNELLPLKTSELTTQIHALDTSIAAKEQEKGRYMDEIAKQPVVPYITTQTQTVPIQVKQTNSVGGDSTVIVQKVLTTVTKNNIPNPRMSQVAFLDSTIADMRRGKTAKESTLLNIRPTLEKELSEKAGFLDELKVMVELIGGSNVALAFWLLWILFFLFIEMLVLFSKIGDKTSDYEVIILHHMNLRIKRLEALSSRFEPNNATY